MPWITYSAGWHQSWENINNCMYTRMLQKPDAGSRTDFWDQKSSDFSGELFSGEEFLPRTAFSGKKCGSILSNQVISWYGSRAVGCPLGREFSTKTCSLLETKEHPQISNASFWKRGRENVFLQISNSGIYESTPQPITGNKVVDKSCFSRNSSPEKSSPEKSLDFWSQKSVLLPAWDKR